MKNFINDYRDFIIKVKDNYSYEEIADLLCLEFGVITSSTTIKEFFKRNNITKKPASKHKKEKLILKGWLH